MGLGFRVQQVGEFGGVLTTTLQRYKWLRNTFSHCSGFYSQFPKENFQMPRRRGSVFRAVSVVESALKPIP